MADFATVADVEARWRPLSDPESAVVETLLADATDIIRVRWGDIDDRVESGAVRNVTLVRIVSAMVRRAMLNRDTEGLTQLQQGTGPFTDGMTFSNPNNNLYLSADDIAALDPYGYSKRSKMGWLA